MVVAGDHGQLLGERGFLGHSLTLDEELIHVPLIVIPTAAGSLRRPVYSEQVELTDVFDLTLELAGLESAGASVTSRIVAGQPIRDTTYAQIQMVPTPEQKALPRWRSALLSAIRTDSAKVILDEEGRATAVRISGVREADMSVSDRLPQLMLADLRRFLHDQPVASDTGSLKVSDDVRRRLRALGYIG